MKLQLAFFLVWLTSSAIAVPRVNIVRLGTPSKENLKRCVVSPDSAHVAWWSSKDETIIISSDSLVGSHSAIVLDGRRGKESNFLGTPVFSPDSNRLAYFAGGKDNTLTLVVDGKEWPEAIQGFTRAAVFSPDSKHIAFAGHDQIDQKPFRLFRDDEAKSDPYADIGYICFSPDSKHIAFGAKRGEKWFVVRDGVESKLMFDALGDDTLRFSPDNKHFVYAGRRDKSWNVVIDEKPSPNFYKIGTRGVHISADGKSISFVIFKDDTHRTCIVDGKPGKEYDTIDEIIYSPEGHHWCYRAADANG